MVLRRLAVAGLMALMLALGFIPRSSAAPVVPPRKGPPLSQPALFSRFARENELGAEDLAELIRWEAQQAALEALSPEALQANADWNSRPQNETSIALHPELPDTWVIGANDYGIGAPIGTGVYNNAGVNYFPPFPLLFGKGGSGSQFLLESPIGTGDPALAYGFTRGPGRRPVVYMASLGFSSTFCENGIFVYRSFDNGRTWTRPVVPPLAPPKGAFTVVYHESAQNCTVFHDKEFITVDNTGGPHDGRIYVTWTRFFFANGQYKESPIMMAYSDDNGVTFSDPIEISGFNPGLCRTQVSGPPGECDENQFSIPVVMPDGTLVVAFENQQFRGAADGFRSQYLVVRVNPDTFAIEGPFKVADLFDGLNDYPINQDGRQTLCNSNFRVNSAGNIAVGPDGTLYLVWSDNRRHAGEFPFPTFVGSRADGYPCPPGKATDVDVFLSKSTDGGRTWSAPVRVNQDPEGNDRDQWFPWVAVAPDGRVDVVFYDRRDDPNNKLAHTYLARSSDGGQTWTEVQVSDFPSNFDDAFFGTGRFIGDYNGLAIDFRGFSFPVWTGVRPGKADSDIFFAVVPWP
ncbi:MAG TPA: sialidase family protein [Thermoflexus sp.]|nr:sialidase family protein [Thermoflexus sp.]